MTLMWDILLNDVSISDKVQSFNIRKSKGAYASELTLYISDYSLYDQFVVNNYANLNIEVKTKIASTWISQGEFYVEQPLISATPKLINCFGIWGRSKTAKAGPPFAAKVVKTWDQDTTFYKIMNEMADLCDLSISFEMNDYLIFKNSYSVDNLYPIDVMAQLIDYIGGYIQSNNDGTLIAKIDQYHYSSADYTLVDLDLSNLMEQVKYPSFGNRIKIGSFGDSAGYSVSLRSLDDSDCLPADGVSKGTLLAFVTDQSNNPVPDNTIVTWESESGATLLNQSTATGDYLLSAKKHQASNFYTVSVDFPIKEVIGIWAYSDAGNRDNFWEEEYGSFTDTTITVRLPFAYCDQSLRITYITSGCAVNTVTAGDTAKDVEVTADVEGASDKLTLKLGNTCACGSSLNATTTPPNSICIGNLAYILVWATISKIPATGQKVRIRLTKGCGELSSENKILKTASILNEASYVENVISGVSQVSASIDIASAQLPSVYAETDTGKANNLYSSYDRKVIDLNTILATGTEVVIDYRADGATLVSWRTLGATKDCDAEVTITMADGTEAGLYSEISLRAKDCTIPTTPPDDNEDISEFDPEFIDQGDGSEDGFEDDGNDWHVPDYEGEDILRDPCLETVMDRILNSDTATNDGERDGIRFGTKSPDRCPEEDEEFDCPCSELCESEIMSEGNIMSEDRTIHDIVSETYEKGTPEYNEEFATVMADNIASCSEDCENNRESACGDCDVVLGPDQLAPGDSAEYTCTDGESKIITMPEGHCGVYTATVGCCSVDIRSTSGQWVELISEGNSCSGSGAFRECEETIIKGGTKIFTRTVCASACNVDITYYPCTGEAGCIVGESRRGHNYVEWEWQCN